MTPEMPRLRFPLGGYRGASHEPRVLGGRQRQNAPAHSRGPARRWRRSLLRRPHGTIETSGAHALRPAEFHDIPTADAKPDPVFARRAGGAEGAGHDRDRSPTRRGPEGFGAGRITALVARSLSKWACREVPRRSQVDLAHTHVKKARCSQSTSRPAHKSSARGSESRAAAWRARPPTSAARAPARRPRADPPRTRDDRW
jgi:hypothetical protein